jgi:transcription elongation factor GreA
MDLEDESLEEYTLVGAAEADPSRGLISTVSPLGKALIGKQKNDEFSVQTPGGELKMKIIDFS